MKLNPPGPPGVAFLCLTPPCRPLVMSGSTALTGQTGHFTCPRRARSKCASKGLIAQRGQGRDPLPLEKRSRISLASRCDLAMCPRRAERITPGQHWHQRRQRTVLSIGKGDEVGAFELDANGEVVAARPPPEARRPGMPGPRLAADELGQRAIALDQEVRGHAQRGNAGVTSR